MPNTLPFFAAPPLSGIGFETMLDSFRGKSLSLQGAARIRARHQVPVVVERGRQPGPRSAEQGL